MNTKPITADEELERSIDAQAFLLHTVKTPGERRAAMDELRRLHTQRTPERVAEMEVERGLQ